MRYLNESTFGLLAIISIAMLLVPHAHAANEAAVSKKPIPEAKPSGYLRGLQFQSWADSMGRGVGNIRSGATTTGSSGSAVATAFGRGPTSTAARAGHGNFGGDTTISGNSGVSSGIRNGQMGAEYAFTGGNDVGPYSYSYSVAGGAGTQMPRSMSQYGRWRRLQSTPTRLRGPVRVAAVGVSDEQAIHDAEAMMNSANQLLYNIGSFNSPSAAAPLPQDYNTYNYDAPHGIYEPAVVDPNYDAVSQPNYQPRAVVTGLTEGHFNSAACEYFVQDGAYCTRRNGNVAATCSGSGYPLCLRPSSELSPYYVAVPEGQMMQAQPMPRQMINNAPPVIPHGGVTSDTYAALSNAQYLMHQANTLLEQIDSAFPSA